MRLMRGGLAQSSEVPLDEVSEERLLVLRAQESPHAFEPLYLRYRDAVINYCFYRLGNHGEAEDAASVIFIKAIRGLADFRDRDGSFRTWLFRIAHNEVVDRLRHRARHPELPIDLFRERSGSERSPEDLAADADAHVRIRTLLSTLPPRERAVLELRAADLDTHQIAAVLGVTEHNVRSTQCRALARMRTSLTQAGVLSLEVVGD